jgi:glycerol-3-phosphate cytidylyltransferase
MSSVGYASGAFDLFHVGHLNLLKRAKDHCDVLLAGVVCDELLRSMKGIDPVIPLVERLEIVRNIRCVDEAHPAFLADKLAIWRELQFDIFFKGDDWRGTEKGVSLERAFNEVGVEVVYFPYTSSTSSAALRRALSNINALADLALDGRVRPVPEHGLIEDFAAPPAAIGRLPLVTHH